MNVALVFVWRLLIAASGAEESAASAGGVGGLVSVTPDDCAQHDREVDWDRVERIIELELTPSSSGAARVAVAVRCVDRGLAMSVSILGRSGTAHREIGLANVDASVRDRVIALAVVEMLHSTPASSKTRDDPDDGDKPGVLGRGERRWQLGAAASSRWFATTAAWSVGAQLGVTHRPRPFLAWRAALDIQGGRVATDPGDVQLVSVSGVVFALGHRGIGRTDIYLGPGVRGGWAQMRGHPTDPLRTSLRFGGAWLGPAVTGGVDVLVGRRVVLSGAVETGFAAMGVRANIDGSPGPGPDGFWLGGQLGLGVRLGPPS